MILSLYGKYQMNITNVIDTIVVRIAYNTMDYCYRVEDI